MKNKAAVSLGRLGGKAGTGKSKARTSAQARAAVNARWAKYRAEKSGKPWKIRGDVHAEYISRMDKPVRYPLAKGSKGGRPS
jgi:hypothetical protein